MAKVCQNKATQNTLMPTGQKLWPVAHEIFRNSFGARVKLSKCKCLIVPIVLSLRPGLEHATSVCKSFKAAT